MMRWILLFLLLTTSAAATPLISGVLYNPAGADTDKEWIELHNPSNETIDTFCSLWFGNGASAADWTLQWEGNISFFPSGYVTIGESGVTPDPDMIVGLNLQNGPDALRLECAEGGDLVGWGDHTFPEYYEGSPASLTDDGFVLSRRFIEDDGINYVLDTQNNSYDLETLNRSFHQDMATAAITIVIEVQNVPPEISVIENCSDDDPVSGIQVLPGLGRNVTFSCDVSATDANGADDIRNMTVQLIKNATVIRQVTSDIGRFTVPLTPTDAAGEYVVLVRVNDGAAYAESEVSIEYLSSIGLVVDPDRLAWEASPGIIPVRKNCTLRNSGNTATVISMTHAIENVSFTFSDDGHLLDENEPLLSGFIPGAHARFAIAPQVLAPVKGRLEGILEFHARSVQ